MLFFPKIYKKNIYEINYKKLSKQGIRCLVFDLDNTLITMGQEVADEKMQNFFQKLKKDFAIFIVSNNISKQRVSRFADSVGCKYFYFSTKPSRRRLRHIQKQLGLKNEQICVIGDQLMTDIFMANRFKAHSCFVEPLESKDLKITSLNRFLEKKIMERYQKKGIFKKGEFYE